MSYSGRRASGPTLSRSPSSSTARSAGVATGSAGGSRCSTNMTVTPSRNSTRNTPAPRAIADTVFCEEADGMEVNRSVQAALIRNLCSIESAAGVGSHGFMTRSGLYTAAVSTSCRNWWYQTTTPTRRPVGGPARSTPSTGSFSTATKTNSGRTTGYNWCTVISTSRTRVRRQGFASAPPRSVYSPVTGTCDGSRSPSIRRG